MKIPGTATRTRRIAVITGSRAEYGLLRSTMREIANHRRLRLHLIVTGTHLLRKFGHTVDGIRRDGWKIDAAVPMQRGDDGPLDQATGLARGVAGIARALDRVQADVVVVLGDRIEAMAGALAAVTTGRLLAHIHGGDVAPGDFDDSLRHAITKLAHLHFTATHAASRRVVQMGEDEERVCCVGAPGLDRLYEIMRSKGADGSGGDRGRRKGAIRDKSPRLAGHDAAQGGRFALVIQHPCGRAAQTERRVMTAILSEVERAGLAALCTYPNSDRGHRGIIQAIQTHARRLRNGRFRVMRSIEHDEYLRLLIDADLIVGNSSSGIIEAAAAGTPAVDVGPRQAGRERDRAYVFHADESPGAIRSAIRKALSARPISPGATAYGDGHAGRRIAAILAVVPLHEAFRRKVFADRTA